MEPGQFFSALLAIVVIDIVLAGDNAIVIALAAANGIPLEQAELPVSGISGWEECFITSTSRHIMPLVRINGQPIGDGRPGPITQHLSRCFEGNFQAAIAAQTPADG